MRSSGFAASLVVIAVIAIGCAGAADSDAEATAAASIEETGLRCGAESVERLTLDDDGEQRSFRLAIPAAAAAGDNMALVLDFHGAGADGELQAQVSGFEKLGASEGFVVVTPDGLDNRWSATDVGFIETLLDDVSNRTCVDPARVYAAGMSNGGFFSARLACDLADRIAGIATVTGISFPAGCAPAKSVPIIHFHGDDDEIVSFDGIPEAVARWADSNGCDVEPIIESISAEVERRSFDNCDDGALVALYVIAGGGHTWPGSSTTEGLADRLGYTTMDIDATDLAWNWFSGVTPRAVDTEEDETEEDETEEDETEEDETEEDETEEDETEEDEIVADEAVVGEWTFTEAETASGLRYRVAANGGSEGTLLVHLHGATQSWESLSNDVVALTEMFDRERPGKSIVIAAPHDSQGWSMWTNSADGSNDIASQIIDELVPDVEATHGVGGTQERRVLAGFSMGGFGAAAVGLSDPSLWRAIGIWDGAMHTWATLNEHRGHIAENQFGNNAGFFEQWSPWALAESQPTQGSPPPFFVAHGSVPEFIEDYSAHLGDRGISVAEIDTTCGHAMACLTREAGQDFVSVTFG